MRFPVYPDGRAELRVVLPRPGYGQDYRQIVLIGRDSDMLYFRHSDTYPSLLQR